MTKKCGKCELDLPFEDFSAHRFGKFGLQTWCKKCRSEYSRKNRNPVTARRAKLKRYGLTLEAFDAMVEAQGGHCLLCEKPATHVDHNHDCCGEGRACEKCVRAILCHSCNVAIGLLGDSACRAIAVAEYLGGCAG